MTTHFHLPTTYPKLNGYRVIPIAFFIFFSLEINNVILGDTVNKKILVILTFFIVIAGMSTACAFNINEVSNVLFGSPKEYVTLAGVDFAIPNGFSEIENESVYNQQVDNPVLDLNFSSKVYTNVSGDSIILSVSASDTPANDSYARDIAGDEANKTTINGVEGYEFTDPGFNGFSYVKNGKLVILSSTDKELFKNVIVS